MLTLIWRMKSAIFTCMTILFRENIFINSTNISRIQRAKTKNVFALEVGREIQHVCYKMRKTTERYFDLNKIKTKHWLILPQAIFSEKSGHRKHFVNKLISVWILNSTIIVLLYLRTMFNYPPAHL